MGAGHNGRPDEEGCEGAKGRDLGHPSSYPHAAAAAAAGTQWADEDAIDRVALARLPPGDGAGMSAIRRNEGLHQASAGDVLWLKGTTFPGAKGQVRALRGQEAVRVLRPGRGACCG